MTYAAGTTVTVDRSQQEIASTLGRYGVDTYTFGARPGAARGEGVSLVRVQVDDPHGTVALYLDEPTEPRPPEVDHLLGTLRAARITRAQAIAWLTRHTADHEAAARVAEDEGRLW